MRRMTVRPPSYAEAAKLAFQKEEAEAVAAEAVARKERAEAEQARRVEPRAEESYSCVPGY
jgi:hypothetical protein